MLKKCTNQLHCRHPVCKGLTGLEWQNMLHASNKVSPNCFNGCMRWPSVLFDWWPKARDQSHGGPNSDTFAFEQLLDLMMQCQYLSRIENEGNVLSTLTSSICICQVD